MKQLIANIRNKPQHHKHRIVMIAVIGMAAFLLLLWVIVGMPPRQTDGGDVINEISTDINENQNTLPDLFPKQ